MENDGIIAGIAFDQKMFGYEAKPLDLILALVDEICPWSNDGRPPDP